MKLRRAVRKGFFFTLDALLAIGVLVIGLLLIMATHSFKPTEVQTKLFSEDLLDVFSHTKVSSADNEQVFKMWCTSCVGARHIIISKENTLLEQIAEFLYREQSNNCDDCEGGCDGCLDHAEELSNEVSKGLINQQYSYTFKVGDRILLDNSKTDPDESDLLIVSRKLVYGIYDNKELFGPFVAEVKVWQ